MSISGMDRAMSAVTSRWLPYQPASISMYSSPNSPAKSMKCLKVSLFIPTLNEAPGITGPFHQSQATLPGLIQDVSAISEGSLRL